MRSLLLVAHGSRREQSNTEVRALTERLRVAAGAAYGFVDCAFLELAEPDIPSGIECCVRNGASEVVVLPYFLAAGRHVVEDIPAEVAQAQRRHPEVRFTVAPHLAQAPDMAGLLLGLAAGVGGQDR